MKTFADFKIDVGSGPGPEVFTTCPQCSPSRKKKNAKCLSVNIEKGVWWCAHCDYRGTLKGGEEHAGRKIYRRPAWPENPVVNDPLLTWFEKRGISRDTVQTEGIAVVESYLAELEERVPCIAFPYTKGGELVNVKYRGLSTKAFQQVGGAEKVLYRQDAIKPECVVVTEGEIDALSCVQAGFLSSVSVPDGAPSPTAKNYAAKFTYLDQDPDPFADVQDIILAVDSDEPGQCLQRELARRLGFERCRFVTWPQGCKDANETLLMHGAQVLRGHLDQAKPFPIEDAIELEAVIDPVLHLYYHGLERGLSTGWESVDTHYTVRQGQLTIVTGIPGHGKSEWLDALAINLCEGHGWHVAICSPENFPIELHVEKLVEKVVRKPFRVGPSSRMTPMELGRGLETLNRYVTFIMPSSLMSIDTVLDRAKVLVRRKGIQGLIIDPFNEFEHLRERGTTETEYIGITLTKIRQWARKHQVHVWLVAHPQKLYRREDGTYPIPTPWDISGSSNWRNKADNCLTVWRDEKDPHSLVQVHMQKIRYKHIGSVGVACLTWDRMTGRYTSAVEREESRHDYQAD